MKGTPTRTEEETQIQKASIGQRGNISGDHDSDALDADAAETQPDSEAQDRDVLHQADHEGDHDGKETQPDSEGTKGGHAQHFAREKDEKYIHSATQKTQEQNACAVANSHDARSEDDGERSAFAERVLAKARLMLPELVKDLQVKEVTKGWRPMPADGFPAVAVPQLGTFM